MFCQSFVLFLTISLSTCLPQLNEGPYSYWRNQPRSIPSNAYYSNHPATYQDPQQVRRYGYQPEYAPYVDSRARGPTARTDEIKEERIMNYPAVGGSLSDTMYNDQNSDFVFPGNIHNSRSTIPTKKPNPKPIALPSKKNPYIPDVDAILKNCKGATFCEDIDYYPKDYIHNILNDNPLKFEDAFGVDQLDTVNVTVRIGVEDGGEGDPMCKANERVIQPPVAKNANDEWKFIVNDADKYIQGIRVELCEKAGEKCAMSQNFPLSYETECKQKYIFRKLLSLDSSGEMQTDNFRLPSCCVCVYRAKRLGRSVFGLK